MIKKFRKNLAISLVVFLLIFLANYSKIPEKNQKEIFIDNGESLIKINAEIADDIDEIMQGLMFREKLKENAGMLFIFENEVYQSFWMKNTLIPLDIIFLDKNFEIVDIQYAVPCEKDPCKLYTSSKPSKYVLEVNEYFTAKNNIEVGNKIILNSKSISI